MIIGVDFDGTVIELTEYPDTNYILKKDAKRVLEALAVENRLILSTARHGWYFDSAVEFIKQNNLPIEIFEGKPIADVYIDDRNLGCKEIVWDDIFKEVQKYDRNLLPNIQ